MMVRTVPATWRGELPSSRSRRTTLVAEPRSVCQVHASECFGIVPERDDDLIGAAGREPRLPDLASDEGGRIAPFAARLKQGAAENPRGQRLEGAGVIAIGGRVPIDGQDLPLTRIKAQIDARPSVPRTKTR